MISTTGNLRIDEINFITAAKSIKGNFKKLDRVYFEHFCNKLSIGDTVITGKCSVAADIIIKVAEKLGIEIQCKSGLQKLTLGDVKKEVHKSVVKSSTDF